MGLQDVFFQLGYSFSSPEALELSTKIQEYIYYNALVASCELAQTVGRFPNWEHSRTAQGKLQFDLWLDENPELVVNLSPELDWTGLRASISQHGLRNSLLIAIAPTATIASIAGCYECIEPQMSNMFKRESLSGEFIQINKYLVNDLRQLGLWTQEIRNMIKMSDGSIQNIDKIPNNIRERYKTVWELSMKVLINMAANRGIYVDQSQSLNIFLRNPDIAVLSSVFFLLYSKNFKSSYYLRSRGASEIMKTTVSGASNGQESRKKVYTEQEKLVCSLENPESCEACQ
jgi:ribonucleoside-diphosphate reductase alpha chain